MTKDGQMNTRASIKKFPSFQLCAVKVLERERERGFREEVEGVGDKVMGEILFTRLSVTSVHVFVFVCVCLEEGGCGRLLVSCYRLNITLDFGFPLLFSPHHCLFPAVRDINPPSLPHQNHNTSPSNHNPLWPRFLG